MITSGVCWIVLGLLTGLVASKVVHRRGQGLAGNIVLGIVGALVGGWLVNSTGADATRFNAWSLLAAVMGAGIALMVCHGIRGTLARG